MHRLLCHPVAPLCAFTAGTSIFYAATLAVGRSLSPTLQSFLLTDSMILILMWLVADARRRRQVPCFDFGFFCSIFFPLSVAWYCCWSRGWWGLLTIGLLIGLWLAPLIVADVTWQVLYGVT